MVEEGLGRTLFSNMKNSLVIKIEGRDAFVDINKKNTRESIEELLFLIYKL